MHIQFLGTSAGTPTVERNTSAIAVQADRSKIWYLVDCGEATQHQLLKCKLGYEMLQAVFITHLHGDHCYGLPGLLATASLNGRKSPLKLFGPPGLGRLLNVVAEVTQLNLSYELLIEEVQPGSAIYEDAYFSVSAVELSHRVTSFGFCFEQKVLQRKLDIEALERSAIPRGPLWGELLCADWIELPEGKRIRSEDFLLPQVRRLRCVIAGDNDSPQLLSACAPDLDLLVHEATYTQAVSDRVGPTPQHSSAKQVAEFAQQQGISNLILTHFSARYTGYENGIERISVLYEEAKQYYSGNLHLARDLDSYYLSRSGVSVL